MHEDGIGDFHGLADKRDCLRDLGVTTVWLLPFYPSLRDDGYDIADYAGVQLPLACAVRLPDEAPA